MRQVLIFLCILQLNCSFLPFKLYNPVRELPVTNISHLAAKEFPDTIRVLLKNDSRSVENIQIIGKFLNLDYKVYRLSYIITTTWYGGEKHYQYIVFIKRI